MFKAWGRLSGPFIWLSAVAFAPALSFGQAGTGTDEAADEAVAAEQKIPPPGDAIALLRKPVKSVEWEEKPFEEVLAWLREQGEDRVNVTARWGPLSVEGIDAEKAVSLKMTHATVAEVLDEVRAQLSEEDKVRLQATKNKITISTKADFDKKLIRKVYYVGDILFEVPNFQEEAPQIDLSGQNSGGSSGGAGGQGGSTRSVFSQGGGGGQQGQQGEDDQEIEERMRRLRDAVILTVEPDSWADTPTEQTAGAGINQAGLGTGRCVALTAQRCLIVLNTIEVHEQLAGWFDMHR